MKISMRKNGAVVLFHAFASMARAESPSCDLPVSVSSTAEFLNAREGLSGEGSLRPPRDMVVRIPKQSERGFEFPFLLYVPRETGTSTRLLVEPNNTGRGNDDFSAHEEVAVRKFLARVRCRSGVSPYPPEPPYPYLMPIFPRTETNWQMYTHALDSDTLRVKEGDLRRIDLQLLAMIDYATELLKAGSLAVDPRVFLFGFSASGSFVTRFAALHPERVRAVAAGGLNGMLPLPVAAWKRKRLPFPIGIADYRDLAGRAFPADAYRKVAQYLCMGNQDLNDTRPFRDAFSEEEAFFAISLRSSRPTKVKRWRVSNPTKEAWSVGSFCRRPSRP